MYRAARPAPEDPFAAQTNQLMVAAARMVV
jgi:hypothetical protein